MKVKKRHHFPAFLNNEEINYIMPTLNKDGSIRTNTRLDVNIDSYIDNSDDIEFANVNKGKGNIQNRY